MFVADLIESRVPKKVVRKRFFGLITSKTEEAVLPAGKHQIIIDRNVIRIINNQGTIDEEVQISDVQKITLKDTYNFAQDYVQQKIPNLEGAHVRNTLRIEKEEKNSNYQFEIDSYSSIRELRKQILYWKSLGINVEDEGSSKSEEINQD